MPSAGRGGRATARARLSACDSPSRSTRFRPGPAQRLSSLSTKPCARRSAGRRQSGRCTGLWRNFGGTTPCSRVALSVCCASSRACTLEWAKRSGLMQRTCPRTHRGRSTHRLARAQSRSATPMPRRDSVRLSPRGRAAASSASRPTLLLALARACRSHGASRAATVKRRCSRSTPRRSHRARLHAEVVCIRQGLRPQRDLRRLRGARRPAHHPAQNLQDAQTGTASGMRARPLDVRRRRLQTARREVPMSNRRVLTQVHLGEGRSPSHTDSPGIGALAEALSRPRRGRARVRSSQERVQPHTDPRPRHRPSRTPRRPRHARQTLTGTRTSTCRTARCRLAELYFFS
jgi:hypothetical protein